jgi:hypothetical protein
LFFLKKVIRIKNMTAPSLSDNLSSSSFFKSESIPCPRVISREKEVAAIRPEEKISGHKPWLEKKSPLTGRKVSFLSSAPLTLGLASAPSSSALSSSAPVSSNVLLAGEHDGVFYPFDFEM